MGVAEVLAAQWNEAVYIIEQLLDAVTEQRAVSGVTPGLMDAAEVAEEYLREEGLR